MANVDRILQDIIKGASRAGASVEFATSSGREEKLAQSYAQGVKDACTRFGLKEAFLGAIAPMAGAVVGPALARGALGKIAPKMLGSLGTGMKGQAFDMAASMGGQMLGGRLGGGGQQR